MSERKIIVLIYALCTRLHRSTVSHHSFPVHFLSPALSLPFHFYHAMQSHPLALSLTSQLNLPHTPVNTLTHRSLPSPALRLASWVDARTRMLFLGAGIFALAQDREVGFIVVLFVVSLFLSSSSIFTTITMHTLYIHQRF
jgi:hypothetical protein